MKSNLEMSNRRCLAVAKPMPFVLASHMKVQIASSVSLGFTALIITSIIHHHNHCRHHRHISTTTTIITVAINIMIISINIISIIAIIMGKAREERK